MRRHIRIRRVVNSGLIVIALAVGAYSAPEAKAQGVCLSAGFDGRIAGAEKPDYVRAVHLETNRKVKARVSSNGYWRMTGLRPDGTYRFTTAYGHQDVEPVLCRSVTVDVEASPSVHANGPGPLRLWFRKQVSRARAFFAKGGQQ